VGCWAASRGRPGRAERPATHSGRVAVQTRGGGSFTLRKADAAVHDPISQAGRLSWNHTIWLQRATRHFRRAACGSAELAASPDGNVRATVGMTMHFSGKDTAFTLGATAPLSTCGGHRVGACPLLRPAQAGQTERHLTNGACLSDFLRARRAARGAGGLALLDARWLLCWEGACRLEDIFAPAARNTLRMRGRLETGNVTFVVLPRANFVLGRTKTQAL